MRNGPEAKAAEHNSFADLARRRTRISSARDQDLLSCAGIWRVDRHVLGRTIHALNGCRAGLAAVQGASADCQ